MAGSPIGDWSPSRQSLAGTLDNGDRVGEVVVGQKVTDFHFDEFEKFFVVDHVALVQEHDDVRNTDLTGREGCVRASGASDRQHGYDNRGWRRPSARPVIMFFT